MRIYELIVTAFDSVTVMTFMLIQFVRIYELIVRQYQNAAGYMGDSIRAHIRVDSLAYLGYKIAQPDSIRAHIRVDSNMSTKSGFMFSGVQSMHIHGLIVRWLHMKS